MTRRPLVPHDRQPLPHDSGVLPEAAAARLLERASELEAARRNGIALADLRAAAMEAGISAESFEAALAEMRADEATPAVVGSPPARPRRWVRAALGVAFALLGAVMASRLFAPAAEAVHVSTVEESIHVGCLAPGDAMALVRPLLRDPGATVAHRRGGGSRTITVRGSAEEVRAAREAIAAEQQVPRSCEASSAGR